MAAVSTVSPAETMNWDSQRSSAQSNLLQNKAQNLYQQQLQGMAYGENLAGLNKRFDQQRMQVPGEHVRRGTFNSGLYRNGLQEYALERMSALQNLQQGQQVQQGNFILGDRGFEDDYASQIQRILAEQYARQAQAASGLGGFL
jgi:hypothetical protein